METISLCETETQIRTVSEIIAKQFTGTGLILTHSLQTWYICV